jgi:[CysO sulfur-carrier protein]-S-L-cysteine hydrolase
LSKRWPNELRLARDVVDRMIAHCLDGRPNEACGLVAAKDGEVVRVVQMANAAGSPVRYALDPREQFMAYRAFDQEGLELAGVFHSHTHTEAYPSPTDVRLASEDVPYLIVSLATDPPSVRAFRIVKENMWDEGGEIEEVPVVVEG